MCCNRKLIFVVSVSFLSKRLPSKPPFCRSTFAVVTYSFVCQNQLFVLREPFTMYSKKSNFDFKACINGFEISRTCVDLKRLMYPLKIPSLRCTKYGTTWLISSDQIPAIDLRPIFVKIACLMPSNCYVFFLLSFRKSLCYIIKVMFCKFYF